MVHLLSIDCYAFTAPAKLDWHVNNTSYRDGLRCIRAAHLALGWAVGFIGIHTHWCLGGSFGSPGRLPGWPHSLLLLRGGTGLVDDITRLTGVLPNGISGLSTHETTGTTGTYVLWSGMAIDAYFLAGGMIFTWLALRHRQYRQILALG